MTISKYNFYRDGILDLNDRLYILSALLSQSLCMGELPESEYRWIKYTVEEMYSLTIDLLEDKRFETGD